jgi:hypothetical protein
MTRIAIGPTRLPPTPFFCGMNGHRPDTIALNHYAAVKDADNVALLVIHDITHVHDGGAGHIYLRVRGKGAYQC